MASASNLIGLCSIVWCTIARYHAAVSALQPAMVFTQTPSFYPKFNSSDKSGQKVGLVFLFSSECSWGWCSEL